MHNFGLECGKKLNSSMVSRCLLLLDFFFTNHLKQKDANMEIYDELPFNECKNEEFKHNISSKCRGRLMNDPSSSSDHSTFVVLCESRQQMFVCSSLNESELKIISSCQFNAVSLQVACIVSTLLFEMTLRVSWRNFLYPRDFIGKNLGY